jgi:hypothetical protein
MAERRARRRRRRSEEPEEVQEQQVEAAEAQEEEEPETDDEEVDGPGDGNEPKERRQSRRSRTARQPVEDDEEVEGADNPVLNLLEGLREGETIVVRRESRNEWVLATMQTMAAVAVQKSDRLPAGFDDSLKTEEYLDWQDEWTPKTYEEKVAWAKKNKVEWEFDPDKDERINHMRVSLAVQDHLGIEKYLPQFRTQAARKEAKEKARMGLDWL